MPVQIQVRTQLQANQNGKVFQQTLHNNLSASNVDGKQKLNDLRAYMEGKGDNAQIRVVNTTRNADLAFQFKSFGYQAYRQERTAGALKQLLAHAGVAPNVASHVVDGILKNGENYRIATKAMVYSILSDPNVQAALNSPANDLPAKNAPTGHIHADAVAPPESAVGNRLLSPAPKLTNADVFTHIRGEYKFDRSFINDQGRQGKALLYTEFTHRSGVLSHFFILSDPAVIGTKIGAIRFENDVFMGQTHKPADGELPPFKYLLRQRDGDQVVGPPMLVTREDLLTNPEYANQNFQVLGVMTSKQASAEIAHPVQPDLLPAGHVFDQAPGIEAQKPVFHIDKYASTYQLDNYLKTQGFQIGASLGSGGFGSVKSLRSGADNDSQVVKYFVNTVDFLSVLKPATLESVRTTASSSEGYAAYLLTSRDKQWVKPNVITPTHYLVGFPSTKQAGAIELQLIPTTELKAVIRENAQKGLSKLSCYGLVMDKAPGQEVSKLRKQLNPNQRATLTQSGLNSLRSLNTRGFVHRDIKPANMTFDGNKLSFIDTGLLFKVRKTEADKSGLQEDQDQNTVSDDRIAQLPTRSAGTPLYRHKELAAGGKKYIGTQADLHAMGLVTLELEAPDVFDAIYVRLKNEKSITKNLPPLTPEKFSSLLDEVIASPNTNPATQVSAIDLKKNIKNPNHLANLGYECLRKADTSPQGISAARWADRQFSDQQYEQLLKHPALGAVNAMSV